MNKHNYRIAIVAGEPSGDQLAADLICQLKQHIPNLEFIGVAGPKMIAAGCIPIAHISELGVMMLHQVLLKLVTIFRLRQKLIKFCKEHKPDLFIGVDFTDFNLSLAKKIKKLGIKTIQYKGPSVWAWRQYRVNKIKQAIDLLWTIFPFEQKFYEKHHVNTTYVGHMLFRSIPYDIDIPAYRTKLKLPQDKKIIAILPGSRNQEINAMATIFIEAAQKCYDSSHHALVFVIAHFDEDKRKIFVEKMQSTNCTVPFIHFINRTHDVLAASDLVLVVSGTATLEAMLFKKPMVVSYKVSKFYEFILRRLIKVSYISLPNLIANERLVPELLQDDANPSKLAETMLALLHDYNMRNDIIQKFYKIHKMLNVDSMVLKQTVANYLIK